jgi:hypothetical protein
MIDLFKKDLAQHDNIYAALQNAQAKYQEPKAIVIVDKAEQSETAEQPNDIDASELAASFQKIKTEEQALLEIKQQLLATHLDLRCKLVKEIDKKKLNIDSLKSEVNILETNCKVLSQAVSSS